MSLFLFFFTDTATTEIYTLSLHDALPIFAILPKWSPDGKTIAFNSFHARNPDAYLIDANGANIRELSGRDRKSTRLNSSHGYISYAVFCLKKKKKTKK